MVLTLIFSHQAKAYADALDGIDLATVRTWVALHGLLVAQVHVGTRATFSVDGEHAVAEQPRPHGVRAEGDVGYGRLDGTGEVIGGGIEPRIPLRDGQHILVGLRHTLLLKIGFQRVYRVLRLIGVVAEILELTALVQQFIEPRDEQRGLEDGTRRYVQPPLRNPFLIEWPYRRLLQHILLDPRIEVRKKLIPMP